MKLQTIALASTLLASTGDLQPEFLFCVDDCKYNCPTWKPSSVYLSLTKWTCLDDCKYHCMHTISKANPNNIQQYYGKWPFYRVFGLQEIASVVFSILNGYYHYDGLKRYTKRIAPSFQWRNLMILYGYVSILVWICSAIFHGRDWPVTEKMDYFSAMLSILVTLLYTFHRLGGMKLWSPLSIITIMILSAFYVFHVSYLSFYKFDYGYNMKASVSLGLLHSFLWLIWVIINFKTRSYAWKKARIVILLALAMSMEFLDFAPLFGIFDAHSLWHMLTIPIVQLHWNFSIEDALYESKDGRYDLRTRPKKTYAE